MVDHHALGDPLEEARDERHLDAELLAAAGEPEQHLVRRGREGDDHVLDAALGHDAVEVPARAEHRESLDARERLLVEEPDRLQAELGPLEQSLRDELPDAAGAEDQRRPGGLARAPGPHVRPAEDGARGDEAGGREEPGPHGLGRGNGVVGQDDPRGRRGHRRDRARADHAPQLVEQPRVEARLVGPARVEEDDREEREGEEPDDRRRLEARRAPARLGDHRAEGEHDRVDGEADERPLAPRLDAARGREDRWRHRGQRVCVRPSFGSRRRRRGCRRHRRSFPSRCPAPEV